MSTMIVTSGGGKKVRAEYQGFTIETDQSVANGGDGTAPEPFMLFLASIGTCAGIYVYSFCQKRDIPTDNVRIIQKHHKAENGKGIDKSCSHQRSCESLRGQEADSECPGVRHHNESCWLRAFLRNLIRIRETYEQQRRFDYI